MGVQISRGAPISMSLDKAVQHGKEKRVPFRKSKRFDVSCRNHGRCSRCRDDRLHQGKKAIPADLKEQVSSGLLV